jgi:serralysin
VLRRIAGWGFRLTYLLSLVSALVLMLAPVPAAATFHLWQISQIYSNADGSVQYVDLFTNANFQNLVSGHTLSSGTTIYTVPSTVPPNLGTISTANHSLLFATPNFASEPGAVPPDFTFAAANFMSNVADTINWAGVDALAFTSGQLPTDGANALYDDFGDTGRHTGSDSPTNFAGQVGHLAIPEPGTGLLLIAGLLGLAGWRRGRG